MDTLALIYTEPITNEAAAAATANQRDLGVAMPFSAHIKQVPLEPERVFELMGKAAELCRAEVPPKIGRGCPVAAEGHGCRVSESNRRRGPTRTAT